MKARRLTSKQKLFAEAYDGNGTEACRKAGYKGNDNVLAHQAQENLRNPQILAIIEARQKPKKKALIAARKERQRFWTKVMRSNRFEPKDRLKASELLGKSEADFVTKHEVTGKDGGPVQTQHIEDLSGYTDAELEALSAIHQAAAARRAAERIGGGSGAGAPEQAPAP